MIQIDQSNKNPILGQEKIIDQINKQDNYVQSFEDNIKNQLIPYTPFQIQIQKPKKVNRIDPNQKIDRNRSKQIKAVLLISLCLFSMGFNRALIAATVNSKSTKQFQKLFNFHGNVVTIKALLSSMNPIGALCGTILCSFLIKQYNARQILLSSCIFGIICSMLIMIHQITVLMIFRFLNGWTAGIFVALIPSFIRQITSKNLAPYLGTAPVINQSLGGLISFILGYAFFQSFGYFRQTWLLMCLINTFPLFAVLIAIKTGLVYQSPIYLLKNGDKQQALMIYQTIYQPKYVNNILKEKEMQIKRFYFKQFRLANTSQPQKSCFRRKDILIAVHLPTLRKMTGIIVIILSSGSMLKTINPKFERLAPIFINLIFFASCFLSNVVQRYMSRRGSFQLGTITICICNLVITLGFLFQIWAVIILVFQTILLIMYGMTLGPLVWPYLPQVVPYRIIPLAQSMNWIVDCVTLSLPGVLIAYNDSPWPLFFAFFLYDFISIFINHFLIVETKQKTVIQIIEKLDENSQKKQ